MKKGKFFLLPIGFLLQILFTIGSHTRTIPSRFDSVTNYYQQANSFIVTEDLTTLIQFLGRPWTYGVGAMGMILLNFLFLLVFAIRQKKWHSILAASIYGIVVMILVIPWIIAYFFHVFLSISYLAYDYLLAPTWLTPISIGINAACLLAIVIFSIAEWKHLHKGGYARKA